MLGLKCVITEGVLQDFISKFPENEIEVKYLYTNSMVIGGSPKYLQFMVQSWVDDFDTTTKTPILNVLVNQIRRFENNLPKLTKENLQIIKDEQGLYSAITDKILNNPKDINSYGMSFMDFKHLMELVEDITSNKELKKIEKSGSEKIYEDDRFLVMKPLTHAASCYYGSGTKWCTAAKDSNQFDTYSQKGNLYYVIDKSRKLGSYYKIAFHITWDGVEEVYDELDNKLNADVLNSVKSLLPLDLIKSMKYDVETSKAPEGTVISLTTFLELLETYVTGLTKPIKINTKSGVWELTVGYDLSGAWALISEESDITILATPFWDGEYLIPIEIEDMDVEMVDRVSDINLVLPPYDVFKKTHLTPDDWRGSEQNMMGNFMKRYVMGLKRHVLNDKGVINSVNSDFTMWSTNTRGFKFTHPPREGTITQRFIDYIEENPESTANQFYIDVLKRSRPRGHNSSFFSAIRDSGIVSLSRLRNSRDFIYTLGPNYKAWTEGKLRRIK
jgi:hypothetical protein